MNYEQILLEQAEAFALHLGEHIDQMPERDDSHRALACALACELSIEHAYALRILFATGAQNAASAMLQVQYEALVRAAWFAYVTTDAELEAMLDPDSGFTRPDPGRMVHGLKAQLAGEPALAGLVKPLLAMNDAFTRVLGMLERGGINPLQHAKVGFPLDVFDTVVRCSNGLMYLAFRLLARQGPVGEFIQRMDGALAGFEDALPIACFQDPALAA
ncbi:hypothetical protein BSY239_192 [Hydrogenophaga sp. RAC07]|uniref:DUF6988 family protein n=1 Tax=Hydrogenophaga sp. RAC07 TaxID=1842537 RepID=UPI00083CD77E|nr:hypothetical protein [Hydrogenophaga sp. RAC07]AOF87780.1 hypothetical protein BSY239_192 [Hydrogenophaga sp. RAC07]